MKLVFIFVLLTGVLQAKAAKEQMVFLVEGASGKQVGISTDFQSYKLLTNDQSWNLYPTISNDANQVAYVKGKDQDDLKLFVRNLEQKTEQVLTSPGLVLHPQFSNNGKTLFFSRKSGEINKIGIINIDSAVAGKLPDIKYIESEYSSFFPAPFQSGETIVFQRNAKKREIVLLNIKEKKEVVIGYGMAPALSKDEKYIAYTSNVAGNWDIYIYDRFNKTTTRVTDHPDRDFSPAFDRYGNLIYTSDRLENGVFSIFKQTLSAWSTSSKKEIVLISRPGVSFYAPRISGRPDYRTTIQAKMIGEPRSSFGTITLDNHVYVIGGHQGPEHTYPPESFTARVTAYDRLMGTWSNRTPRPYPSHGFQLATDDKYIYAFGGFAYDGNNNPKWKSLSVVERYNPASDTWEELGHMPRRRSSNVAMRVEDKVYLIGGWDATPKHDGDINGTFHAEIDVFDLKTLEWSTLSKRLPKKRRAFSAFVKNGKIYLLGGISEGGSHFSLLKNFTVFDPKTETFYELPELPFATFAPAAGNIGETALLFGGMFKTGDWSYEYVPHIYEFNFVTQKWVHTGRYLKESKGFSQVVSLGRCLGILGGHSYQNDTDRPVDTFEQFCLD